MQNLITVIDDEARVSHRLVADNTENKQKNIAELIHKYREDFDEFGGCPFKTETLQTAGGKQEIKTYYLNEPQATFLMTLLRNKSIVVEFKKRLVKEFYSQREQLQTPSSPTDLSSVMVEMLKTQQLFIENQQKQTEAILSLAESIQVTQKREEQLLPSPSVYIDSRDRKKIREAVREKAKEIADEIGVRESAITPSIWIELKYFFEVDDYQDIHKGQVGEVMHYIMFWEPTKKHKTQKEKTILFGEK